MLQLNCAEFTNIWLDALIKVVPYLSNDVVKRDVLPMAISKGRLSQPTSSRLHSCKIIGAISQKFDANTYDTFLCVANVFDKVYTFFS